MSIKDKLKSYADGGIVSGVGSAVGSAISSTSTKIQNLSVSDLSMGTITGKVDKKTTYNQLLEDEEARLFLADAIAGAHTEASKAASWDDILKTALTELVERD